MSVLLTDGPRLANIGALCGVWKVKRRIRRRTSRWSLTVNLIPTQKPSLISSCGNTLSLLLPGKFLGESSGGWIKTSLLIEAIVLSWSVILLTQSRLQNSTATGPDGLAPWHLKHLGAKGLENLTATFNLFVATAEVPSTWKSALVIPIPKPGKPAGKGPSFRPVSLLCPAVKILERLLLPSLKESLTPTTHQHGFRQHRSTTSALLPLITKIADGMKQPKSPRRSAVVAIDISQAFDRVPIPRLLAEISQTNLHPNITRWLRSYLRGRQAAFVFRGARSSFRRIHFGVPQGIVIQLLCPRLSHLC